MKEYLLPKSKRSILPFWVSLILAFTFVITGVIVTTFAYLSLNSFLNRPLNPLAEAAESVIEKELTPMPQEGTAPDSNPYDRTIRVNRTSKCIVNGY